MTEDRNRSAEGGKLRRRAEARLQEPCADDPALSADGEELSAEEMRHLVHELQVHQIELEMQNEELRRAQEELVTAHDQYVGLYDFAPVGYFTIGEEGLIERVNLRGATLLGAERNALVGQPFSRFVAREDQDVFYRHRREMQKIEGLQTCELRLRNEDGTSFYARLECEVAAEGSGAVEALQIAVSDISASRQLAETLQKSRDELEQRVVGRTEELQAANEHLQGEIAERLRVEQMLRQTEQRYKALFEEAPVMYISTRNLNGSPVIDNCNQIFLDTLGYGREEVLQRPLADFYTPESRAQLMEGGYQETLTGKFVTKERQLVTRDGRIVQTLLRVVPETDPDGKVVGTRAMFVDITERRHMEEELIRLERLRARGEMATGISHNLNNLLNGILAPAQILQRALDDPSLCKWTDLIVNSTQRASDLVRRLHHTVLEEEESLEAVDVNAEVEEGVETTRGRWQEGTRVGDGVIEVVTDLETVPPIQGTSSGLHDVLVNLILNAVEAMPEGGRIALASRQVGDWVEVRVADTGVGMDEETRRRVFEPFFTTKQDVGSGLGLYTAYAMVTDWGGTIAVESASGEGTTFLLRLPVWRDPEEEGGTGRLKVLLVEDEEVMVEMLTGYLGEVYELGVVRDGQRAVDGFVGGRYDVALIDLLLPGMAGDQVAGRLRQVDPSVVLVLVTGVELSADDPRLSAFDLWYQKPIGVGHIDEMMEQAVQLRRKRETE